MSHWKKKTSMPTQMGKASLAYKNAIATTKLAYIGSEVIPVCPFEFVDGFETGDFSLWKIIVSEPYSIITSPVHHGTYAAKAISGSPGELQHNLVAPEDDYYIRFYFLITGTTPTGGSSNELLRVWDEELAIYIITGGAGGGPGTGPPRFELQNRITGAWADGATSLVADTWYCVELLARANNATAVHKLWLDGVEEISLNDNTSGYKHTHFNVGEVSWGAPFTGRVVLDCFLCGYTRPTCAYNATCKV